jgi:uncharacterized beta-barrel protein YwiB (DUF1934 family)
MEVFFVQVVLSLLSTIKQIDGNQETIKQRIPAQIKQSADEVVIQYEDKEDIGRSLVNIVATSEHMQIERNGSITYKQRFIPRKKSNYMMRLPMGDVPMELYTNEYQLYVDNKEIYCRYQLFQLDYELGSYELLLSWR